MHVDQDILDLISSNTPEFSYVDVTSNPIWQIKVVSVCLSEMSSCAKGIDSHYLCMKMPTG